MYINIFSVRLLNGDSSFTQAKTPPCELNTLCFNNGGNYGTYLASKIYLSKKDARYNQVPHLTQDFT